MFHFRNALLLNIISLDYIIYDCLISSMNSLQIVYIFTLHQNISDTYIIVAFEVMWALFIAKIQYLTEHSNFLATLYCAFSMHFIVNRDFVLINSSKTFFNIDNACCTWYCQSLNACNLSSLHVLNHIEYLHSVYYPYYRSTYSSYTQNNYHIQLH